MATKPAPAKLSNWVKEVYTDEETARAKTQAAKIKKIWDDDVANHPSDDPDEHSIGPCSATDCDPF